MSCGCGCGQCDGMLSGLMGQITVPDCVEDYPVIPGAKVQFGFNTGFAPLDPTRLGRILEDQYGLIYYAQGRDVAGIINPYVTVEGNAARYFDSSCDFCYALWLTLKDEGVPIKPETIRCFIEQIDVETGASQGPQTSLQPAASQPMVLPSFPSIPGGAGDVLPDLSCLSKSGLEWIACELGVTRSTAVFIGVSLALVGVLVLKR